MSVGDMIRMSVRPLIELGFTLISRSGSSAQAGPVRVVVINPRSDNDLECIADRVVAALELLMRHDRQRWVRATQSVRTVTVFEQKVERLAVKRGILMVSRSAVERLDAIRLAVLIVNHATFARVVESYPRWHRQQDRVDCICRRAELRFVARVPGAELVRAQLEDAFKTSGCSDGEPPAVKQGALYTVP